MNLSKRILPLALAVSLLACATLQAEKSKTEKYEPILNTNSKAAIIPTDSPNPVVNVVRKVREAVVQIKVEATVKVQNYTNPFFDDDFFLFLSPTTTAATAPRDLDGQRFHL